MLLQYVAVKDSAVRCRIDSFNFVEICDGHECVALFLEFRNEHLESFDCWLVACEVVKEEDVSVLDCCHDGVVSFLCSALRYPILASYAADECVRDGLMH